MRYITRAWGRWIVEDRMRVFTLAWASLQVTYVARGQEGEGDQLTQDLILAASPFVQAHSGWQPSSLARRLILSSGRIWRKTAGDEGSQQPRGGRSLYSPYSPGPDDLRCRNIHFTTTWTTESRISFYSRSQLLVCIICVCGLFGFHS